MYVFDIHGLGMPSLNIVLVQGVRKRLYEFVPFQQSPQYEPIDTLIIMNFADTFDLRFQYIPNYIDLTLSKEFLNIQVHDSLVDYNGKMWFLSTLGDDSTTEKDENVLKNDTIIFYFKMDNIKFYINEAQPYYYCECKHVAVKQ